MIDSTLLFYLGSNINGMISHRDGRAVSYSVTSLMNTITTSENDDQDQETGRPRDRETGRKDPFAASTS